MIYMLPLRGAIYSNCYLDIDEDTGHGFLIDPGAEGERLARLIRKKGWTIEQILLTHGHFDHFSGVTALRQALGQPVPVGIHASGGAYLTRPEWNLSPLFGPPLTLSDFTTFQAGDRLRLSRGRLALEVLHTPGHTLDSVLLLDRAAHTAFVGNTILKGRPGIVHHPTGDLPRLLRSIRETVLSLPEDTDLLPGHAMPTTVAAERELYL